MKTYTGTGRMRGRISYYVVPILLLILVVGYVYFQWAKLFKPQTVKQQGEDLSINWKVYEDKKYGFSLKYPQNWEVIGQLSNNSFSFWSTEEPDVNVQIAWVFPKLNEKSIEEKFKYIKEQYSGSEYSVITSPEVKGILYITETKGSKTVPTALIAGERGILYLGMENIPTPQFNRYHNIFKEMISSFKFTP